MKPSRAAFWLSILVAVLGVAAAAAGLFWTKGAGPQSFETLRGQTVELFARGLYRYDSVFTGANYQGQDAVVLFLGVPLLALAAAFYRRGSRKGALLLAGILSFFLYVYASMALGAAYNPLFLAYVALFSASFFALILTLGSIGTLPSVVVERLPRLGPALFMFAGGVVTLVVWLAPLIASMLAGRPPELLGGYATMVTDALDLAIIMPATFAVGALILRRSSRGYTLAFPLLGIIIMLLPTIALGTVSQLRAGISYGIGEIVGPIAGFALLGALAVWVLVAILPRLPDELDSR
ncbi:MAG: hypothetical protein JW820_11775 [Spirochaetales bacterium]|nr:hypothetical protein [Spirochaetales bacterium]